jgi:hypothetical protein
VALVAAGALFAPATASADDQSIYNAFHTSHPRFVQLRHDFDKAEQHWQDSGFSDPGPAYKATRRTASLARRVSDGIRHKTTSTAIGAKARARVMSALNQRRRWADTERHAIEAFMSFDGDGYLRLRRQAKPYPARWQRYEKQARELFKQAGVNLNP